MQIEIHAIDSSLGSVAIYFWAIVIHQGKNFELSFWSHFNHFIKYLWDEWTDNCPVTNFVILDCWLDYRACTGDIVHSTDVLVIWTLHFDIYEHFRSFLNQLEYLIKSWNPFAITKVKWLQLLTRIHEGKFSRLSIFRKLAIISSMEDHWDTVCTYPNIKLDAFDSMLDCKSEIFHAVFWTKITPSMSHYDCPSIYVR